jgi:Do/DeqQ family serine protease
MVSDLGALGALPLRPQREPLPWQLRPQAPKIVALLKFETETTLSLPGATTGSEISIIAISEALSGIRRPISMHLDLRSRRLNRKAAALLFCAAAGASMSAAGGVPIYGDAPTLAPVVDKVVPGVVNIAVSGSVEVQNPLFSDPIFRQFFRMPNQSIRRQVQSAGSGVIVDAANGYVLTNNHVVAVGQEEVIEVTLKDKRHFRAKLVGRDPETDIAVLKINADHLTEVEFGDSDRLRVGDYALAIGNPFGLGLTVTSGIISALGRTGLGIEGYEDFIQTDAAINPGNSGGALVNIKGQLIGVNTAILGPSGSNTGIGFAVPANIAKEIMLDLIKNGDVKRGQIGILPQDLTPDIASSLDIETSDGALVAQVAGDGPAARAGVQAGDLIVGIDGVPVHAVSDFRRRIDVSHIGDTLTLTLIRDGQTITRKVTVETRTTARAQSRQWN